MYFSLNKSFWTHVARSNANKIWVNKFWKQYIAEIYTTVYFVDVTNLEDRLHALQNDNMGFITMSFNKFCDLLFRALGTIFFFLKISSNSTYMIFSISLTELLDFFLHTQSTREITTYSSRTKR